MRLKDRLDEIGAVPDIVVGVHYGGIIPAADLSRNWYRPIRHVEVEIEISNGVPVCKSVRAVFDLSELAGKSVLVIDNSIRSGKTLRDTVNLLRPNCRQIRTCILHRPGRKSGNYLEPDYVIFYSDFPIKSLWR
jgi:hypoxanthine phosphoribosyltransferase